MDRCSVNADNVWFSATGSSQAGPIVLLNCTFHGKGSAESHQRWSTGMLYDNCTAPEGEIEIRNRGSMGSGHGWSMGWGVVWNCQAKNFLVQNPPGAENWLIGSTGALSSARARLAKGRICRRASSIRNPHRSRRTVCIWPNSRNDSGRRR